MPLSQSVRLSHSHTGNSCRTCSPDGCRRYPARMSWRCCWAMHGRRSVSPCSKRPTTIFTAGCAMRSATTNSPARPAESRRTVPVQRTGTRTITIMTMTRHPPHPAIRSTLGDGSIAACMCRSIATPKAKTRVSCYLGSGPPAVHHHETFRHTRVRPTCCRVC